MDGGTFKRCNVLCAEKTFKSKALLSFLLTDFRSTRIATSYVRTIFIKKSLCLFMCVLSISQSLPMRGYKLSTACAKTNFCSRQGLTQVLDCLMVFLGTTVYCYYLRFRDLGGFEYLLYINLTDVSCLIIVVSPEWTAGLLNATTRYARKNNNV